MRRGMPRFSVAAFLMAVAFGPFLSKHRQDHLSDAGRQGQRHRFRRLMDFTRRITENDSLQIDEEVYASEKRTGNKNRALAYLLKKSGMIYGSVEELLDVYFAMCSVCGTGCGSMPRAVTKFIHTT